jgi:hypothetical protein
MRKPKNFRDRVHQKKFYEDAVEWQLTLTPDDNRAYIIPTDVYLSQFSSVILIYLPWASDVPVKWVEIKYVEKGKGDQWWSGHDHFFEPADFATPDRFIEWIRGIVRNSYGYTKKQNP